MSFSGLVDLAISMAIYLFDDMMDADAVNTLLLFHVGL